MGNILVQDRHVWISAGHTNVVGKDRGVFSNGHFEGDLTVELRDLICQNLDDMGIKYTKDNNEDALRETLRDFKPKTSKDDLVIDIHFNASAPKATGCEVFVPLNPTITELDLAESCSVTIHETLDIPLRGNYKGRKGVKAENESQHNSLGWMRIVGENILLEICFISNPSDLEKYLERKEDLAHKLACDISAKIGLVSKSSLKKAKDNHRQYTVISGDYLSKIAQKFNVSVQHIKTLNALVGDTIYVGQVLNL